MQPWQKFFKPCNALDILVCQIDGAQFFPVGLKRLYVSNDLNELVMRNAERCLGQESCVGLRAYPDYYARRCRMLRSGRHTPGNVRCRYPGVRRIVGPETMFDARKQRAGKGVREACGS